MDGVGGKRGRMDVQKTLGTCVCSCQRNINLHCSGKLLLNKNTECSLTMHNGILSCLGTSKCSF